MSGPIAQTHAARIRAVTEAPTENFRELLSHAGLDPTVDLRFHNWSDLSLAGEDLTEMDFSGARLLNCDLRGATIAAAHFHRTIVGLVGDDWYTRTNLRSAVGWAPGEVPPTLENDGHLRPGMIFQDAPIAPAMVVVPAGTFDLGPHSSVLPRKDMRVGQASPRRRVTVARAFAVSEFVITAGEFAAYRTPRLGGALPSEPIGSVTWHDAAGYADWLSELTQRPYRLLSEAEWEYCCRSGGREPPAKPPGDSDHADAGRHAPNRFGLRGMADVGAEWCADTWHETYDDAPDDGGAWIDDAAAPIVQKRVVRGWLRAPLGALRDDVAAVRDAAYPAARGPRFRVATSLVYD